MSGGGRIIRLGIKVRFGYIWRLMLIGVIWIIFLKYINSVGSYI